MSAPQGPPFAVRVQMRGVDTDVVASGEVDLSTAREFRDALLDAVARASRSVVLDLRDVTYLDSTGVHALYDATEAARDAGKELRAVHVQPPVVRVFELSGIADVISIERDD